MLISWICELESWWASFTWLLGSVYLKLYSSQVHPPNYPSIASPTRLEFCHVWVLSHTHAHSAQCCSYCFTLKGSVKYFLPRSSNICSTPYVSRSLFVILRHAQYYYRGNCTCYGCKLLFMQVLTAVLATKHDPPSNRPAAELAFNAKHQ